MKVLGSIACMALAATALMLSSAESLGQACDEGGSHTIQVRAGDDGMPVLSYRGGSAEEVHVCVGDTVQWVLTGSDRAFFVDFFAGAPFDGAAKRGSSNSVVSVVIGDVARQGYDYGVGFADGEPMDPRVVVK